MNLSLKCLTVKMNYYQKSEQAKLFDCTKIKTSLLNLKPQLLNRLKMKQTLFKQQRI